MQNDGREYKHPDSAGVLKEDGICRGRPLRRNDERRETGGVADDGDQKRRRRFPAAAAPRVATEEKEKANRGKERAIEGDFECRIVDSFDADAAARPEQGRA